MREPLNPLKNKEPKQKTVCKCEKEIKFVTWRNIKNKFPQCSCGRTMKVITNADTIVSTPH